jgi:hypothetical protein
VVGLCLQRELRRMWNGKRISNLKKIRALYIPLGALPHSHQHLNFLFMLNCFGKALVFDVQI